MAMRLTEVLRAEHVAAPLQAETIRQAVAALVQQLADSGSIAHPERLDRLTADDRIRDIIHVGDRVLLPHMRTDAVDRLVVGIGIAPAPLRPLPGVAPDSAQVVVLVLAPLAAPDLYLQMVAALARALRSDETVDRLVSVRSPEELLAIPEMQELVVQPRLTVRDIMTQRVYRVVPETPVRELLELMSRHNLNAVPVVGPKREVLGIVSERDLLRHLLPTILRAGGGERDRNGDPLSGSGDTPVRDIMSRTVMCISEEQAIAEVASIMINKDVERLPVVSEGRLTGFLTRSDIVRKLFSR